MLRKSPKQPKPVNKLRDELDKVFSEWIRRKDADKNGMVKCYTSGKFYHWKQIQCGHFISRRHMSTRWYEKNCKPQSVSENIFNQGNAPKFAIKLIEEYGQGILEELEIKKNSICKMGRFEYERLINEYKEKIKNLD
jgi:hypothetical protein